MGHRRRAEGAYGWVEVLGHPGRPLAATLGVHPSATPKAARREAADAAAWRAHLMKCQES